MPEWTTSTEHESASDDGSERPEPVSNVEYQTVDSTVEHVGSSLAWALGTYTHLLQAVLLPCQWPSVVCDARDPGVKVRTRSCRLVHAFCKGRFRIRSQARGHPGSERVRILRFDRA
jgi:hypothetical protein